MIIVYGDSHGYYSFKGTEMIINHKQRNGITMFRIGRDNTIINFNKIQDDKSDNVLCLCYGEIDCRIHISNQISLGRNEDDIISSLVSKYFTTLRNNITICKNIIIVGIIPTKRHVDFDKDFNTDNYKKEDWMRGTDEERVRYTKKMNALIQEQCKVNNYIYFNPYKFYENEDGTLKHEFSDSLVHLKNNEFFLQEFQNLLIKHNFKYNHNSPMNYLVKRILKR
jgi:hypothetical protein